MKGENTIFSLDNIWVFAQTEKRLTFRLARYWIFLVLAFLCGLALFAYHSVLHAAGSAVSASMGLVGPRFLISSVGFFYLVIFIVGIIFLAFDVRARDSRERMLEVLDAKPYSNLELVLGRFLGLFIAAWIPVLVLTLVIQGLGWLLPLVGSPVGETVEPVSLFGFPFFIALPAIAFSCALVILIALVVRHQVLALIISIAVIAGLYSLSLGVLPYAWSSSIDLMGFHQLNLPSDLVPSVAASFAGWIQRFGIIVLTIGLLILAAIVHPRLESGQKKIQTVSASIVMLTGIALIFVVFQLRTNDIETRAQWRIAHEQLRNEIFPDISSMDAYLIIQPGSNISVDVSIVFKAPNSSELNRALFSLNPGMNIVSAKNSDGQTLTSTFDNGLLSIDLPNTLAAGESTKVDLKFEGRPNTLFAYLDSAVDFRDLGPESADVAVLGIENAIFTDAYVALMPAIHWLPSSGVDVGRDDTRDRPKDYFQLSLKVNIPKNWIVAGPGRRTEAGGDSEFSEFYFQPQAPIAELAIITAPFVQYQKEIDNITFELLLNPKHTRNIAYIEKGGAQIEQWVTDKIEQAKDTGLEYPFKAFTLIEVPNSLRGYAGGWRNATALSPPSMALLKETSLPTARFDIDIAERLGDTRPVSKEEDGEAKVVRNRLIDFFANDFTGGNVFTGAAASYFSHQMSATGSSAIALDYTLEQLSTLVLFDQRSYFSVALIANLGDSIEAIITSNQQAGTSLADRVIVTLNANPKVWENALNISLDNMDPWKDPGITIDTLNLKAGGAAKLIYDVLGVQRSGQLLADLLAKHRGASYTRSDFISALNAYNGELGGLIDEWYTATGLAGFSADDTQLYQLSDNSNGDTRFQLALRINNDEAVSGYTRVSWANEAGGERTHSEPIRIQANTKLEYGVILSEAPVEVYLEPYLSLNRNNFLVQSFNPSEIEIKNAVAFDGVRSQNVTTAGDEGRIVVDDLDRGFRILSSIEDDDLRLSGSAQKATDNGLPVGNLNIFPDEWSRISDPNAWGQYRHTLAFIRPGNGQKKASFSTTIPTSGRWKLEIHLPELLKIKNNELGGWTLEVISEEGRELVVFNASSGNSGWNTIGEYDFSAGNVSVELSDKTDKSVVIADAVAWSPLN